MSDHNSNRFAPQNQTTSQRLSTNTVGLVALSDFRKRRAEVLEQQERESREASTTGTGTGTEASTPGTRTPDNTANGEPSNGDGDNDGGLPVKKKAKKKKKAGRKLLSFDDDEEGRGDDAEEGQSEGNGAGEDGEKKSKFKANASVGVAPKAMTKAALRKEATERETLRREFLAIREAVKATEVAIPFIFYDGTNIPGGTVRMKKGDLVWLFLDKSRKVGAELGVGESANATKRWARVGVDDLMLVRGSIIVPHHYDFYYFLINKSLGPGGERIFNYSADAPSDFDSSKHTDAGLSTAESKAAAAKALPDVSTLEGAKDDPTITKVVDRRWYQKNKHIYPASTWQDFDADKDYSAEVRRDAGGNAFFFSR